jgi:flagellin-like protein
MNYFIKNRRGVSNVVGALMLILIVISASTAIAVFIAQTQEVKQQAEMAALRRSLENLDIIEVKPDYNDSGILNITYFSVANFHSEDIRLNSVFINGLPLYTLPNINFTIKRGDQALENWSYTTRGFKRWSRWNESNGWKNISELWDVSNITPHPLYIHPRELITFRLTNLNEKTISPVLGLIIDDKTPITIKVTTVLTNVFEETFFPPTTIIMIKTEALWNGSNYQGYIILDGSLSDHPGNGYIAQWYWTIENATDPNIYNWSNQGRKIRAEFNESQNNVKYIIKLEVIDNFGMRGKASLFYTY